MEHARPPTELTLEGGPANRADAWRKWYKQFEIFLKASGVNKEAPDVQASLLINLIGPEGYDIYSTFKFIKEEERDDIKQVIKKFNDHFISKPNTTMTRFKFFTRNQEKGETIDDYVTALRLLSQQCEFDCLEDGLIRDRIVCGVLEGSVRDRLLRTDGLTLETAVKICQASEMSNEESRHIEDVKAPSREGAGSSSSVDAIVGTSATRGRRVNGGRRGRRGGAGARGAARVGRRDDAGPAGCCPACGYSDCDRGPRCPAIFSKCLWCNRKGHFMKMCPVKSSKVYELCEEDSQDDELFYVDTLDNQVCNGHRSKWFESLILAKNGTVVNFKLDTGSDLNVISINVFESLGFNNKDLLPSSVKAQSFCGNFIPIAGSCIMQWVYKARVYSLKFVITLNNCQSVLGKYACEELGIIKRILSLVINDYDELFNGLGRLPGKYTIHLEKDASPSVCPVRKIPIGIRDKLMTSLNRMVELGVVRKVTHPTPWVNAIVVAAKKDGDIRICLDPRPLNRVIRRAHYPLPTLTEIATKLQGARFFSKLDSRSGYWMIEIDDKSADLCTFGTPFGRYQFLRLPYGINCASEVFHARVRQLLEDLEGVDSFVDDIIVWGSTVQEHDLRLKRLLDRAREVGIRFNRDKCEFCVEQVTYLGHTFSAQGMQIDKSKLKAVVEMPTPKDRSSLERFLGMVNYLSKFIPYYSETVAPLRGLLKKGVEWTWDSTHDAVVSNLRDALCCAPVLALYEPREPVLLSVDASAHALGAVMMQGGRPVEFASVTLTETQKRYAQIEKEMLAIVFALERFHQYIFGRDDVTVESDHKPLEALFKKSLDSVPARLQRMMLRVQAYDFKVVYKPGRYMYIADTLSRAALPQLMQDKVSAELAVQSCFVIEHARFSGDRLQAIRDATLHDTECQVLIKYILEGWPNNKSECEAIVRPIWAHREGLEYIDGVVFKDNLVYVPAQLRSEMIRRVHEGHLGIERCKRRARDVMFWCGMSRDVERAVRRCRACAENTARPRREPMIVHPVPDLPWAKVGTDICQYGKKYFLIIVDYLSNFIEVCPLTSINSSSVIKAMKDQFARHGIPVEVVSDNGPAYASREFAEFSNKWGFTHTTSSPNYAQSNGLSERAVRTVKGILKKSVISGTDFYLGLLNFRATPRDGISSPAQLLMGRRLNTLLPAHGDKLRPERSNDRDYHNIMRNKERSKKYYDAHSRPLYPLQPGDDVMVTGETARQRMRVKARAGQPRSYLVTDKNGKTYRRNRRHLIKLPEHSADAPSASPQSKQIGTQGTECAGAGERSPPSPQRDGAPEAASADPQPTDALLHNERHRREAAQKARERIGSLYT